MNSLFSSNPKNLLRINGNQPSAASLSLQLRIALPMISSPAEKSPELKAPTPDQNSFISVGKRSMPSSFA